MMPNLPESPSWEPGIHQLEETDRAKAGPGGVLNIPATQLANRTKYLLELVKAIPDYREYTFYTTESDPDGTIQGVASTKEGQAFRVGLGERMGFRYYIHHEGSAILVGESVSPEDVINVLSLINYTDNDEPLLTLNDQAGFRLAAMGLNELKNKAINIEYNENVDGFIFRDEAGFIIQKIGVPLISAVDSVQPVIEQKRIITEAFSAEYDPDVSGLVFRDSVGFVLLNLNGEQGNQDNSGADDISRRNAANLAVAAAMRDEINTRIARPVYDYNILITDGQSLSNGNEGWAALSKDIRATLNINMLGDSVRPKNENGSTFTPLNGAEIRSARAVVQDLIAPPDGGNLMTDEAVAALPRGANNFGETVDIGAMWMWREMQLQFRGVVT
ncbi:hypothetical protein ABS842_03495, partial [Klebsiella pneumoniae]